MGSCHIAPPWRAVTAEARSRTEKGSEGPGATGQDMRVESGSWKSSSRKGQAHPWGDPGHTALGAGQSGEGSSEREWSLQLGPSGRDTAAQSFPRRWGSQRGRRRSKMESKHESSEKNARAWSLTCPEMGCPDQPRVLGPLWGGSSSLAVYITVEITSGNILISDWKNTRLPLFGGLLFFIFLPRY